MAVSGSFRLVHDFIQTEDVSNGANLNGWLAEFRFRDRPLFTFSDGTGDDQADLWHFAELTIASGADSDIDLSGVLNTIFGGAFNTAEVAGFFLINKKLDGTANTTALTVDCSIANAWTGMFAGGTTKTLGPIGPGGHVAWYDPVNASVIDVSPGTADLIRITNATGAENKCLLGLLARSA